MELLIIEQAHRILTPWPPSAQKLQPVLIQLLKSEGRDGILCIASQLSSEKGPINNESKRVMFFLDPSSTLVQRRKVIDQVKKELHSREIPFALLHPATLRITLPYGKRRFFKTQKEAATFLRNSSGD